MSGVSVKTSITKVFEFESAHNLPWHEGKCHRPHGHSYKLHVTITGPVEDDTPGVASAGMVMDFADIGRVVKRDVIERLDHHNLNDYLENPTGENIAQMIWDVLERTFHERLTRIQLWETSTGYVTLERC